MIIDNNVTTHVASLLSTAPLNPLTNFGGRQSSATALAINFPTFYKNNIKCITLHV